MMRKPDEEFSVALSMALAKQTKKNGKAAAQTAVVTDLCTALTDNKMSTGARLMVRVHQFVYAENQAMNKKVQQLEVSLDSALKTSAREAQDGAR